MGRFDKILVPVDGSNSSLNALKMAVELHKVCKSKIIILSVYRDHSLWSSSVSFVKTDITSSTDAALAEFAQEVAQKSKDFVKAQGVSDVRSFYIGGGPARTIIKFAKKHKVDLIILGRRGLSDSTSDLLGAISHKVTSMASCPVMVV